MNNLSGNKNLPQCELCGAVWLERQTCESLFHQLGYWEFAEPESRFEVHHLMVLCYHIQHPVLYSKEGLHQAIQLLREFVDQQISPVEVRNRFRQSEDFKQRSWSIRGSETSRGAYTQPMNWTMTIADVVAAGETAYVDQVWRWAKSIHLTLSTTPDFLA